MVTIQIDSSVLGAHVLQPFLSFFLSFLPSFDVQAKAHLAYQETFATALVSRAVYHSNSFHIIPILILAPE